MIHLKMYASFRKSNTAGKDSHYKEHFKRYTASKIINTPSS